MMRVGLPKRLFGSLARATTRASPSTSEGSSPIEIVVADTVVRVPVGVDIQHLRQVLQALRA